MHTKKERKEKAFKEASSRIDSDQLERDVLEYWEKEQIFKRSLEERKDAPLFTFYDGPPYATGKPHYGHVLQSAIKDTVLRYKTMSGHYVPRRVGWDTHGLPIENIVEKELGIQNKKEIEEDIAGFNAKCQETVHRYVDEFQATLQRIGRWADYDNAYSTLDRDYMESEWWVFRQLWDQELVYKAFKTTAYCTRCVTPLSNFEVSMGYKDKGDLSVYVLLPVSPTSLPKELRGANQELRLLVWTTTPWTLPGNSGVAINPDIVYVSVEHEGREIVVAEKRVEALFGKEAVITKKWQPDELFGLAYEPLYGSPEAQEKHESAFRVMYGDHVTAEDGTGLVHMAPAFGQEDAQVGEKYNLPLLRTVDTEGRFLEEMKEWQHIPEGLPGKNIFEGNKDIIKNLKERELLFKQEFYTHSYPFCWRCDTPLIYYALDTWFVKVQALKESMVKNNEQISWIPEHVKHGRFGKGIESAPDWAVSRNRFWSVPMPVWECSACQERICVGSVKELQDLSEVDDEKLQDIHRPYVDDIEWDHGIGCGGRMRRIQEVLDVWFDSGSMPYSQWHYPFDNKEFVEAGYPADFIAESIEMTRAWFYVLHVLAAALTKEDIGLGKGKPAYKNVIASGLIFAEDGQKLSKKLKNYPEIEPTLKQYGADVLRFYLLSSTSLGEPYRFSEKDMRQVQRNTYFTLWNVYSFFVRYANVHGWHSDYPVDTASSHMLDRWIIARTAQLERDVRSSADAYHIDTAARLFIPFIDDLSNWYVRRSRQRFQKPASEQEMHDAFGTLHAVLARTVRVLAPFMPFMSEEIFRNITGKESVHLELFEQLPEASSQDEELLEVMKRARGVVTEGLALRARHKLKVRQPLATLVVMGEDLPDEVSDIIRDEVNVKEVIFAELPQGEEWAVSDEEARVRVALHTALTIELKQEGIARDIIRHGQVLRRQAGYALDDTITLIFRTKDADLQAALTGQRGMIEAALQLKGITEEALPEDAGEDITLNGKQLHLGVVR